MDDLSQWVGRTQRLTETIDARLVRWLAATLDRSDLLFAADGAVLPPAWHWSFFNAIEPMSALGRDGHPKRGGFLPPTAQILKCEAKRGKSGDMVLVTVGHQFRAAGALLLDEEHDIVYRDEATAEERRALVELAERARAGSVQYEREGETVRVVAVGPVQMFRYSAATFNGHRIHYDRDYAREVEGYPGLVVHGPLIATLLLEFLQAEVAPGRGIERFEFRAMRPTFDIAPFALHASRPQGDRTVALWSTNNVGAVGMQATALLR
jgi:3-methylfumaryl-CoA hydratase